MITPSSGIAFTPLTVSTSAPCAAGDFIVVRVTGKGFPAQGENVVGASNAAIYPKNAGGGMDIPLQNHLRFFADKQVPAAVLTGRYELVVSCRKKLGVTSLADFRGALWFTSPTAYVASDPAGTRASGSVAPSPPASAAPNSPPPIVSDAPGSSGSASGDGLAVSAAVVAIGVLAAAMILLRKSGRKQAFIRR